MKFLAIDSPVMRVLGRLGDIIILNMIFVVGCIPVITIGTSLCIVRGSDEDGKRGRTIRVEGILESV